MTTTELAVRNGSSGSIDAKLRYAQALADSNLLPPAYRRNPANVLLAVELGEALGIPPIQAINGIHVIDGKPSASADLIGSLVRRAGHKLRIQVDTENLVAVATIIRADDPDFPFEARWDMSKAQRAKLTGKGSWITYPDQMLRNRAVTEVARMGASDALYGVIYTPEELGAEVDADGTPIVRQVPLPTSNGKPPSIQEAIAAQRDDLGPAPLLNPGGSVDVPPAEPDPNLRTEAQSRKLGALIRENAMSKDEALPYFASVIGREISSTKELTKAEASKIIDVLESASAVGADPRTGEVPADDVVDAEVVE